MTTHVGTVSTRAWCTSRTWLAGLLPIVPAVAVTTTTILFLANWPYRGNHAAQAVVGLCFALIAWLIVALVFGAEVTNVETASSSSYDQLCARVKEIRARESAARQIVESQKVVDTSRQEALDDVGALVGKLEEDLHMTRPTSPRSNGLNWLLGHGYVNAWREVHAAEDALLTVEPPTAAVAMLSTRPKLLRSIADQIREKQTELVQHPEKIAGHRELVSRTLLASHKAEDNAWEQIVILRNQLFLAFVLAIVLAYAVLTVPILQNVEDTEVTSGIAFFLVGAVVGVFSELYVVSRPSTTGSVFDYGLGHIRLLVTPVISGFAGLGGAVLTGLSGQFVATTSKATTAPVALADIFNLKNYSAGLLIAAVFGLTPGLLISRLRDRADQYKWAIQTSGAKPPPPPPPNDHLDGHDTDQESDDETESENEVTPGT